MNTDQRFSFLVLLLLFSTFQHSLSSMDEEVTTFTFKPSLNINDTISYAILNAASKKVELPDKFLLCLSHLQSTLDNKSFLTILGQDGTPWVSLSILLYNTRAPELWLQQHGQNWLKIMDLRKFRIIFWSHTCIQLHIDAQQIKVAVGDELSKPLKTQNLKINKPLFISNSVYLGLSHQGNPDDPKQFVGSLANSNIFRDDGNVELRNITNNLCGKFQDTLIHAKQDWTLVGNVIKSKKKVKQICPPSPVHKVGIATPMKIKSAKDVCRKLSSGYMMQIDSDDELAEVISIFRTFNGSCTDVWTPLTDEKEKGIYRGSTDEIVEFLPWKHDAPNGGKGQNDVALDMAYGLYEDRSEGFIACTMCEVLVDASFTFTGICQDTLLSKDLKRKFALQKMF